MCQFRNKRYIFFVDLSIRIQEMEPREGNFTHSRLRNPHTIDIFCDYYKQMNCHHWKN